MKIFGETPTTLLEIFKPMVHVMHVFSVCPMSVQGSGGLVFLWKTMRFGKYVGNFTILSLYALFISYQLILQWKSPEKRKNITAYVELGYGMHATLLPISTMFLVVKHRHDLSNFYTRMGELRNHLNGYVNCSYTWQTFLRLFIFYIFIGTVSGILQGIKAWQNPYADAFILNLFQVEGVDGPPWVLMGVAFQTYVDLLKSCACAYVEILTATLALAFVKTMKNVARRLEGLPPELGEKMIGDCDYDSYAEEGSMPPIDSDSNYYGLKPEHPAAAWKINPVDALPSYDVYFEKIKNQKMARINKVKCPLFYTASESKEATMFECIKRFKYISEMQILMNDIYGTMLAQNVAFIMVMCCALCFLQIRYAILQDEKDGAQLIDRLVITASTISAVVRLLLLFTCLGDVHHTSVYFNGILSRKLVELEGKSVDVGLISAYVTVNAVSPVSVSAGGYFTFNRGSLMAALSIIATYVIFLLQVQDR